MPRINAEKTVAMLKRRGKHIHHVKDGDVIRAACTTWHPGDIRWADRQRMRPHDRPHPTSEPYEGKGRVAEPDRFPSGPPGGSLYPHGKKEHHG